MKDLKIGCLIDCINCLICVSEWCCEEKKVTFCGLVIKC